MQALLLAFLLLTRQINAPALDQGWKGITPVHSTRQDIERLWGLPNNGPSSYSFADTTVTIVYSDGDCAGGWKIPKDRVRWMFIQLKYDVKFKDLNLDLDKFEKLRDPELLDWNHYRNKQAGISYIVQVDNVRSITLTPSSTDSHLKC